MYFIHSYILIKTGYIQRKSKKRAILGGLLVFRINFNAQRLIFPKKSTLLSLRCCQTMNGSKVHFIYILILVSRHNLRTAQNEKKKTITKIYSSLFFVNQFHKSCCYIRFATRFVFFHVLNTELLSRTLPK